MATTTACNRCGKLVQTASVFAQGLCFHRECFVCDVCDKPFPDEVFYQNGNAFLCEEDFNDLLGYKCDKCKLPIEGECLNVLDTRWHPRCFVCKRCGVALKGGYMRFDDKPYCHSCHDIITKEEHIAALDLCFRCKKLIDGVPFIFKGSKYHAYHFNCTLCKKELSLNCKEFDGKLYCPEDYEKVTAPSCYACKKLILGPSITALGKAFHIEHFVCHKCEKGLEGGAFYEYQGKAFCELHYHELTGIRCERCLNIITGNIVNAMGKKWCENHFLCTGCYKDMAGKTYGQWDQKAMCESCYLKLPIKVQKRVKEYGDAETAERRTRRSTSDANAKKG